MKTRLEKEHTKQEPGSNQSEENVTKMLAHTPPSSTPRMSDTSVKSARNGDMSVSSVSWGSLNQEDTGTALLGWKMYEAGELSKMIVSPIGRPSWLRSWDSRVSKKRLGSNLQVPAYLDIISLVEITAFTEEPM